MVFKPTKISDNKISISALSISSPNSVSIHCPPHSSDLSHRKGEKPSNKKTTVVITLYANNTKTKFVLSRPYSWDLRKVASNLGRSKFCSPWLDPEFSVLSSSWLSDGCCLPISVVLVSQMLVDDLASISATTCSNFAGKVFLVGFLLSRVEVAFQRVNRHDKGYSGGESPIGNRLVQCGFQRFTTLCVERRPGQLNIRHG